MTQGWPIHYSFLVNHQRITAWCQLLARFSFLSFYFYYISFVYSLLQGLYTVEDSYIYFEIIEQYNGFNISF